MSDPTQCACCGVHGANYSPAIDATVCSSCWRAMLWLVGHESARATLLLKPVRDKALATVRRFTQGD